LFALVDLGRYSIVIGLVIAVMKASMMAAFFMHAPYDSKLV
jgi:caa(3)-type oxidase subunit IV